MLTSAPGSRRSKEVRSRGPLPLGREATGGSRHLDLIHRLQRTIGNQAVLRQIAGDGGGVKSHAAPSDNQLTAMLRGVEAAHDAAAHPGGGAPLSHSDREAMSARFGYDLSRVRIHTGSEAARSAGARGFTSGEHVWFGPGHGSADKTLLVHELTHVVQQATGETRFLERGEGDPARSQWLEQRARDGSVAQSTAGGTTRPLPVLQGPPVVQFDFEEDTLRELHRLPAVEEEGISDAERKKRVGVLAARYQRLLVLFASLPRAKADAIWERLHVRIKGDILSERFHDMLATETRKDLIANLGFKGYVARQLVPDASDFCRPFSAREIDQGIDFVTQNEMDHFINGDLRDFWGNEAANLFDKYLTSTEKNVSPVIFDRPSSELVQSFIKHPDSEKRTRDLAANIEKNLECTYGLEANTWFDYRPSVSVSPDDLKAPFSFSGFDTIPGIVAGGVSPAPGVPESRELKRKQVLLRRDEAGGVTQGVKLRIQFSFVVKDAIDFCPGNMGGLLAGYVTIPLSRLEASGMAFAVPFQVLYDGPVLDIDLGPETVKRCTPKKP